MRHALALAILACAAFLSACFEQKQTATINPDGSGKVFIETDVAVPTMDAPGKVKPTAVSFGREFAARLINSTKGADAWADVSVTEAKDGRAHIEATAYFKDINTLKFDMPLDFTWKKDLEGATLTIQRARSDVASSTTLSDKEIKDLVKKAEDQYDGQKAALRTQLSAFKLTMSFVLPGELDGEHLMARNGNTATIVLEGKKAADALDKFMKDDAALTRTFRQGKDSSDNDDIMLQSMYGEKGPVTLRAKFKADEKPQFDFKTELQVAQLRQLDMLKEAGVELVPKFRVLDTTTAPATTRGK